MANNVLVDVIDTGAYANSFYGTYDHYQRIGWYFDKIVDDIADLDLEDTKRVLTGRFVLVKNEDAIFMRTSNEESDTFTKYEIVKENDKYYIEQVSSTTYTVEGFRFIGYASRRAMLLFGDEGYIDVNAMQAYKIAGKPNVRRLSAYYFPTQYNAEMWQQATDTPEADKEKLATNGSPEEGV